MFTGIVQAKIQVHRLQLQLQPGLLSLSLQLPSSIADDVNLGASIAIDGVCLTVTSFDVKSSLVQFDVIQQTLDVTTLSQLNEGDWVNVERSARLNAEVGGHHVSGHIDSTAKITCIDSSENNRCISYQFPQHMRPYLFDKGFVSLNGCSLTISAIDKSNCVLSVSFIPETLRVTNHGLKQVGDHVNIELDRQTQTIVDTVERVMAQQRAEQ